MHRGRSTNKKVWAGLSVRLKRVKMIKIIMVLNRLSFKKIKVIKILNKKIKENKKEIVCI